jgi:hypothetical protein
MGCMQGVSQARFAAPSLLLSSALAVGCAEKDEGITYTDMRPLFEECAFCHRVGAPFGPGTMSGPDIVNPDSPEDGLLEAPNQWYHEGSSIPARLVVPGAPDDSFLINKIADPALGLLPEGGGPMPYVIERITMDELALVEQWVSSGAEDNDFFRGQVYPIFVGPVRAFPPSKCDTCHFAGTPNPPDMADPFGPEGIVGVRSNYRSDMLRVAPGDVEGSLLVQRLRLSAETNLPNNEYGAPMPRPVTPLNPAEVDLVRQWISEGARL